MQRRTFLRYTSAGSALLALESASFASGGRPRDEVDELFRLFLAEVDRAIGAIVPAQTRQPGAPTDGGFAGRFGIYPVGSAAWNTCTMVAGYVAPASRYWQSAEIEQRLTAAMQFVRRLQHDDGTIDLVTTNFHSPPDTAFVVEPIALALGMVRRHAADRLTNFQQHAETFLRKAGEALAHGGVHTPNHRWVVCMALARINALLPNPKLVERADQWLAEGIDIDGDGQYTERSTSGYSPLINRWLITVARLLDRPEIYEAVRRNLDLTMYFVRPNGELVTEVSRRQDQYTRRKADGYYYAYRYLACLDQNGAYAAMARFIEQTVGRKPLYQHVLYALDDPVALQPLPSPAPLPDNYARHFPGSQIVRIRRGDADASIVAANHTFFAFHKGGAALRVRLASAFFGKGQFQGTDIEREDDHYLLKQRLRGRYVQPLGEDDLSSDGNWFRMPHERRTHSEVQKLRTSITLTESDGRFRLRFHTSGTERVPVAVEMAFRHGGELRGVAAVEGSPDTYLPAEATGKYEVDGDTIHFGGGPVAHHWTQVRGALPKLDAQCVYYTCFTPADFAIEIW